MCARPHNCSPDAAIARTAECLEAQVAFLETLPISPPVVRDSHIRRYGYRQQAQPCAGDAHEQNMHPIVPHIKGCTYPRV